MTRWIIVLFTCLIVPMGACRDSSIEINVRYDQVHGLTVDRRVVFQGRPTGVVESIEYTREGSYVVTLAIDKAFSDILTEHARFYIVDDPDTSDEKAVEIRNEASGGDRLASGSIVTGSHATVDLSEKLQKDIESGLQIFKEALDEIRRDIHEFPESKEYQDLKRSMEGLARELMQKERGVREKFKRKWLPRIQRELDDLRERLKQLDRENDMAPLEEQMEHLRSI